MSDNDETNALEVSGPGGVGVKFKGASQMLLVILLAVVTAAALFYAIVQHEAQSAERDAALKQSYAAQSAEVKQAIREQTAEVQRMNENQKAMIYILTLDEKQRKALNLSKPQILKDMQR